ncbi:MFS transporter [Sciscionella marina]|uniref:MFS transporter n=1 Tax=Sciscionella marina TaxID=508770 RepID=UPI00036DFE2E|nr:MFS transporter [Sciscionella marina]
MDNTNTPGDPNRPRAGWNAGARPRKAARRQERRGQGDPTRRTPPPEQPTQRRQPPPRPSGHEHAPRNQPPPWSQERTQRTPPPRQEHPRQEHPRQEHPRQDPRQEHPTEHVDREEPRRGAASDGPAPPDKISVARVAAWRARQGVHLFKKATEADGAGESGLSQLTYAYMFSYGSTAALSVALANTLFFAAANAESKTKVFLYLLITIAPFALVAPVIGPLLDRIRRGRRIAMAASCAGQAICAVIIALNYNSWVLYPAALAFMVLDKSFTVLKAAVTPRVLPSSSTLVTTNARLTTFGLIASGAFGAVAAGLAYISSSQGALVFCALIAVADAVLCMRIPSWVEDTKDEVPASLTATMEIPRDVGTGKRKGRKPRQSMGRNVVLALWANATIKLLTGFMVLFGAFVVKAETVGSPFQQMLLLALVAGSAGAGSFVGNAIGARIPLRKPDQILVVGVCASLAATVVAALLAGVFTAAIVGLIGGAASAMVKICLDSVIQSDLPERSRASAFGRSETVVQLAWVIGGAIGVLLPAKFWLGFTVISVLLAIGLAQVLLTRQGRSLIPGVGGDRPVRPEKVDDSPLPKRQRTPTRTMPTERL